MTSETCATTTARCDDAMPRDEAAARLARRDRADNATLDREAAESDAATTETWTEFVRRVKGA